MPAARSASADPHARGRRRRPRPPERARFTSTRRATQTRGRPPKFRSRIRAEIEPTAEKQRRNELFLQHLDNFKLMAVGILRHTDNDAEIGHFMHRRRWLRT